mgnify:CR=1 FL=1
MEKKKKTAEAFEKNLMVSTFSPVSVQILFCGEELCGEDRRPSYEPHYASYSLHYVYAGAGYIQYDDGEPVRIKKGDIFFLLPNHSIRYYPEKSNPWRYAWITFTGLNLVKVLSKLNVTTDNPVVRSAKHATVGKMLSENVKLCTALPSYREFAAKGCLYHIFTLLLQENCDPAEENVTLGSNHIVKAQEYIEKNYHNNELSLSTVAEHCNLNKAYLSRLFVKTVGVPMSNYIMDVRIHKARQLFSQGETSVKKVAYMVGFDSPYYFCKVFKALNQSPPCTPSMYIAQVQEKAKQAKECNGTNEKLTVKPL